MTIIATTITMIDEFIFTFKHNKKILFIDRLHRARIRNCWSWKFVYEQDIQDYLDGPIFSDTFRV